MSETDTTDLVPTPARSTRRVRWKPVVGLLALAGLIYATVSTLDDVDGRTLPGWGAIAAAVLLQIAAMGFAGRAWIVLFPPGADRAALANGFYTSQLTKYLPAGGFVQAASQVALSRHNGGLATAALRLPVFSLCAVVASFSLGSTLAFDTELPIWGRALAACGILSVAALDRRVLAAVLKLARRAIRRLPAPDALPPQRAILVCYGLMLFDLAALSAGFAILLWDLTDANIVFASAAFCIGWGAGFLALPIPSGLFVREGVLLAALPGVATGTVLAVSITQRIVGFVVEAVFAGIFYLLPVLRDRHQTRPTDQATLPDHASAQPGGDI